MAQNEATTRSGIGTWTTQHGFGAKDYAQTAADVLEEASGNLVVTPLPEDTSEFIQEETFPQQSFGDAEGWREWAGDDFDTLANLRPSSDPDVVPVGQAPPGWQDFGGRGGGPVGPTAEGMAAQGPPIDAEAGGLPMGEEQEGPPDISQAGREVAEFLSGATAGYTGQMEDRTNVGSRARIDAQRSGEVEATLPPAYSGGREKGMRGSEDLPAETWGPGPTESVWNQQIDPAPETWGPGPTGAPPGWTDRPELEGRHPPVAGEGAVEEQPMGALDSVVQAVVELLEQMKGFSLSPEEFGEITNMSPEQLTEVYNNLARQQGRPLHKEPTAWNRLGAQPFQSPESAALFQGRVPMSEEVVRPGEAEYSQWNIPSRETRPGFMAQDYAQAQPGTTDWMRQIYPWARNLPENVLQRAIQDGDYLRMLMQKAEAGAMLPLM